MLGEGHTTLADRINQRDKSAKRIEALLDFLENHVTVEASSRPTRVKNEMVCVERTVQQQKEELRGGDKTGVQK